MRYRTAIVLAALAVAAAAAWWLWPDEERRVRDRLEAIATALSAPANEPDLARLARVAGLREFLAEDVSVELPGGSSPAVRGREAVVGLAARMPPPAQGIVVDFLDVDVRIDPDSGDADVQLKARVVTREAEGAADGESRLLDARMVALTMGKVEGAWVIASARVMPADDSVGVP